MVSEEGLEPPCLATADFKSALYTSSSIPTCGSDEWSRTTTESILSRLPLPIGLHRQWLSHLDSNQDLLGPEPSVLPITPSEMNGIQKEIRTLIPLVRSQRLYPVKLSEQWQGYQVTLPAKHFWRVFCALHLPLYNSLRQRRLYFLCIKTGTQPCGLIFFAL